ncbi:hypothetical protein RND71_014681 [Anisodus tanguticus]|uniref:Uncharacterized protein n=1 Tax=Anisodus tanguticus TaxID=243964 RepID=A0AAE1SD82_9SOLA|nr:hypothetical protein RND71_014681 [Anisodus tanguticus]
MGLTMKQEESPLRSYIPVPQGAENQQEPGWASSSKSDSQYSYACDESVLRKTKSIEVVDKVFDKSSQRITRKNRLALTTDIVEGHFSNSEVNKLEREEPFSEVHGAEIAAPYDYHDFDKVEAEISSLQQEVSPDSFRVGFIPSENTVIYAITVNYTSEPNVPSLLDSLGPICPNFDDGTPLENHVVDDEYEMLDQILLMYGINVTNLQWDDSEEDELLGLEDDELSENNVGNICIYLRCLAEIHDKRGRIRDVQFVFKKMPDEITCILKLVIWRMSVGLLKEERVPLISTADSRKGCTRSFNGSSQMESDGESWEYLAQNEVDQFVATPVGSQGFLLDTFLLVLKETMEVPLSSLPEEPVDMIGITYLPFECLKSKGRRNLSRSMLKQNTLIVEVNRDCPYGQVAKMLSLSCCPNDIETCDYWEKNDVGLGLVNFFHQCVLKVEIWKCNSSMLTRK